MTSKRANRRAWAQHLDRWRRSGLELRAFAAREELSVRALSWWRWRLEQDEKQRMASTAPAPDARAFIELSAAQPASPMFEVVLGNGRSVRVPPTFEDAALLRVLIVAEGGV